MKTYILIIFSLFISSVTFAQYRQDTTTLYVNPGYNKDPMRSKWDGKVEQKGEFWELSLKDKKGVLRERICFEDKNLEIRKGPYLLNESGSVKEEGFYNRGYKTGEWQTYYPNKQIKEKANYRWDLLNGQYVSYWPNGQLKKQGEYLAGRKIKDWAMFYENGKPALKESYDQTGKLINSAYFESNGEQTQIPSFYIAPSYPGGIKSFYRILYKEIKNNKSNEIYATYGTIRIEFTVKTDGSIADVVVKGSPDKYLDGELIRVMKLAGNWIPAKELGDPIRVRHIIPIKFFLN
jgi:TonB family protein